MSETPPMSSLVERLSEACSDWLEVNDLPSPPATTKMLRATDKDLAEAVKVLCRAYPKKLGCDRHPTGRAAIPDPAPKAAYFVVQVGADVVVFAEDPNAHAAGEDDAVVLVGRSLRDITDDPAPKAAREG